MKIKVEGKRETERKKRRSKRNKNGKYIMSENTELMNQFTIIVIISFIIPIILLSLLKLLLSSHYLHCIIIILIYLIIITIITTVITTTVIAAQSSLSNCYYHCYWKFTVIFYNYVSPKFTSFKRPRPSFVASTKYNQTFSSILPCWKEGNMDI